MSTIAERFPFLERLSRLDVNHYQRGEWYNGKFLLPYEARKKTVSNNGWNTALYGLAAATGPIGGAITVGAGLIKGIYCMATLRFGEGDSKFMLLPSAGEMIAVGLIACCGPGGQLFAGAMATRAGVNTAIAHERPTNLKVVNDLEYERAKERRKAS